MQAQLDLLQSEVRVLRAELSAVREEVVLLRQQISQQSGRGESPRASISSFSLVSPGVEANQEPSCADRASNLEPLAEADECGLTWAQRERIAEQAGRFIAGALRGEIFGTLGRERIRLKSRLWIVARDYSGFDFKLPRIFRKCSEAKPVVKRGDHLGRSVLVGLPSERECRCAVRAAGLAWPSSIEG